MIAVAAALGIALLAPGPALGSAPPQPPASPRGAPAALSALPPALVLARYRAALAALKEPRVFAVEYTMQQTGTRTLEQTHRIFRSGGDERDETIAVNGNRSRKPVVRVFHRRPYRYAVAALAPKPNGYAFAYVGPRRAGKHLDYVFSLTPKAAKPPAFAFTQVTIDGVSFLPRTVAFAARAHAARGTVSFTKAERYWVASAATAQANVVGGVAHEQLAFANWRFPAALPRSTFALPRPLPTLPPALP